MLLSEIRVIHRKSRETYGSPRVTAELRDRGIRCGRNRVARIMRDNGICAKMRRKFKRTTDSRHNLPVAANLLDQDFAVGRPNSVWAGDITYVPTDEGWLYLATVLDLYSRQVVGWSMKRRMTRDLVVDALKQAVGRRKPPPGLIHHSDRGSQYASGEFQELLNKHGFLCSMSRKGNCYDNACVESFFGTLKTEMICFERYKTRDDARRSIFEYIEVFYNRQRKHSTLGYKSPVEFEISAKVA